MKSILCSLVFVFLSLSLLCLSSCSAANMGHQYNNAPHLFAYKNDELLNYAKKAGYSDFGLDEITRNSTGTVLYLHNFYRTDKSSLILSASANGEIKKLAPPSRRAYTNDEGEFVAWSDDIKRGMHFKDGRFRSLPWSSYFGVAPGGQFFFIGHTTGVKIINNETVQVGPIEHFTEVGSTDDSDKVLYSTNIEPEKIFFKDNKIYLFARPLGNFKGLGKYEECEIICQVLKRSGSKYELEEEIHIPRPEPRPSPFAVVDLDPWSENVLLVDVRDMPFSFLTAWYLFNLKTKKETKIGRAKDYGFFLKEDILEAIKDARHPK